MNHSGNFALVTGASSGIGWHISEELARRDYNIIAVSDQESRLEELKLNLEQAYNISVLKLHMDLAKENAATQIFDFCEEQGLQVEVLVNNAGMLVYGEALSVDYSQVKAILQLHVSTPGLLCRLFGEKMIDSGKGFILNVSSISSVMPYPTISLYGPTKAFLRYFTRAIRTEMQPFGIRVTCLLPGATNTTFYKNSNFSIDRGKRIGIVKNPGKVAASGVNALFKDRAECIPGFLNKLIVNLLPLLPYFIIRLIYRRLLSSRGITE